MKYDVLIIGGGAAGLAAAVSAKMTNPDIKLAVVEKNDRVAKKILATGNGRCNFTNENISPECYFGDRKFIKKILDSFTASDAIAFFSRLGVMPHSEDGRIYPRSERASSIADALRLFAEESGAEIITSSEIKSITRTRGAFHVGNLEASRVIVACGGAASPAFGTDGKAYSLLTSFGHRLTPASPALTSVKTDTVNIRGLKGVRVTAHVRLFEGKTEKASDVGEVLFADYGVSGIPVFQVSRFAKKGCTLLLDVMPDMTYEEVVNELTDIKGKFKNRKASELYSGIADKRLLARMLKFAEVADLNVKAKDLTDKEIRKCGQFLKHLELPVLGASSMANAQVTAGGIELSGFNPDTMESKYQKGLYAAGEILDCDGLCGGYNLHWAWATGSIAGASAASPASPKAMQST